MKNYILIFAAWLLSTAAIAQSFNTFPVTTQKPPLHGRHWMAVTGKPLSATAGAMIFSKGGNAVDAACAILAANCTMC
jgi:gamma-glutamyltranspeptidase/glutathione hydrolase